MLQFQQHLFCPFFSSQMTSGAVHYDVIYHPFPINSQYLKTWGVDSSANRQWLFQEASHVKYGNPSRQMGAPNKDCRAVSQMDLTKCLATSVAYAEFISRNI